MDQTRGSFEALVYGSPSPYHIGRHCPDAFVWRWRQLPMPPFVENLPMAPSRLTRCCRTAPSASRTWRTRSAPTASTRPASGGPRLAAGGCPSTAEPRSSLSSTAFASASRIADRLPNHLHLCAVDFSSIYMDDGDSARPPKLRHQWPVWANPDYSWMLTNISMAYMGAGRFCIAQTFCVDDTMRLC
ncbi:hypothetical protein ACQ4PT_026162 [Festuca glaucescens]